VLSGKVFKLEEVDSIWRTPWETRPKIVIGTGASEKDQKKEKKKKKKKRGGGVIKLHFTD
jgi:hypothetical protein